MEADCQDYLVALNNPIGGNMGLVMSTWDNVSGQETFDSSATSRATSCDGASQTISNIVVRQWGSTENPSEDDSDPQPDPDRELVIN
jgi:hypothetical protein|mmetsp:Transcript_23508/g.31516  ORF Transcript_23508/g.31516 Transcript_23508/m.31516 type:complete len:87 (-) Transcript_23508:541-801(-)